MMSRALSASFVTLEITLLKLIDALAAGVQWKPRAPRTARALTRCIDMVFAGNGCVAKAPLAPSAPMYSPAERRRRSLRSMQRDPRPHFTRRDCPKIVLAIHTTLWTGRGNILQYGQQTRCRKGAPCRAVPLSASYARIRPPPSDHGTRRIDRLIVSQMLSVLAARVP